MKSSILVAAVVICLFQVFVDADLIENTCRKTPKLDLCTSSLRSFLIGGREAKDVRAIAQIMTDVILRDKATATRDKIVELRKQSPTRKPLITCSYNYNKIVETNIEQARMALDSFRYNDALQNVNGVEALSNECRSAIGFLRDSPLVNICTEVSDFAEVAASIILQLS